MGATTSTETMARSLIDEDSLAGRVALVTGGTRGIGAAISLSLMRRGATVAAGYSSNRGAAVAFRERLNGVEAPPAFTRATSATPTTASVSWTR